MRPSWLADPARRAFTIAVVCSILLHILLLASLVWVNRFDVPVYAKRGEPLIVDIAPDKPEEKAPLGNPAHPPGPTPPPPPPKVAQAPAARAKLPPAPAPRPPALAKAPPPPPEPPKQVAKAAPPEPEAHAREATPPAPSPAPVPVPQPTPQPQEAQPAPGPPAAAATKSQPAPPTPPSASSEGAANRTALAKPPAEAPSIFRPGGGGGLHGGRGGSVGEPIPLDTPDPNYREYMEKVRKRIYANWGYPYEAQQRGLQGKLVIEFHIAKDGHLQFIDLRQTSGEDILDSFAMTAVKLAQLYPPLPDAMQRDVLPVVGIFVYTLRGPLSVLQSLH